MTKFQPLYDRVLVQRTPGEEKTSSGIIIPDTAKEKPLEGVVRATGKGKRHENGDLIALQVKEGDRVLFGKYSGTDVTINGEDHLILREDEILAIIVG
ncbi:MAG: co-chaperone GroES [Bradymonadaceae bacterium]|nr:co-chaperone GroES [Lujinxingiaceae bacterium]